MEFANKEYFILILLLIPYIVWYLLYRKKSVPSMRVSTTEAYRYGYSTWRTRLVHVPMVLHCICYTLLVCVLARPQTHNAWDTKSVEGIDIMLAMDVSTSMLAEDLKPNRLEAAKNVAAEFIAGRPNDNIGLTIFAGESFTQCPMKSSKAKSKVVILLTDGSNNMGDISPMTSAEIAKSMGIRVYTIAVGTNKVAPYPVPVAGGIQYVNMPVEIDTKTLEDIAQTTGGSSYRATNNKELSKIYKDIDTLEKTKMDVKRFSKRYEAYQPFLLFAVLMLLVEIVLRNTVLRKIP